MSIDHARFHKLLSDFKLEALFNELGWDHPTLKSQAITVNGDSFTLSQVANKRGVAVLRCTPDVHGKIPARPLLLKIEREAAKIAHEHLLVFADAAQSTLTWLWVARAPGQPTSTRTHTWHKGQSSEALRQKLNQIVWSLDQEDAVTLTTVITGLKRAFDRDRVSRSFYDSFKAQHDTFADFIKGLADVSDRAWYASLMLNRLMFVYFIQKKGFLDRNETYLSDRLAAVQAAAGKGKFHSFYRQFLRRLFHEGLGQAKAARTPALAALIGDVPYLNGGLFALHELEEANPSIDVPDEAFERLFAFFDAWDWHLDDRPLSTGNEINPDVLGYIFEKYINQKQMGAYYTKEDITEYISKNTVIPHLLDRTRERCKVAFDGVSSVLVLLQADPQRYIYPAMKTGVLDAKGKAVPESTLPDFVQTGMHDPQKRMFERRYNLGEAVFQTATGERGTLPTETWREYVERRTRCLGLIDKLKAGEVKSADDLITLNLDIRQFMQDLIDTATSPDLLRAVWQAIVGRVPERSTDKFLHGITILDPTCGSGAFLFAALNVLEPLYEGCLDRMEGFVEDAKKLGRSGDADFVKVLAEVANHPSRSYYVYKNIILHNLFGVDIMAEAVEICKLRLFLKLVSQVDAGGKLEPLPDIDFNIRAGNTLVGYATEAQFDASATLASDLDQRAEIKASTADLADAFDFFRQQQTVHGGKVTAEDKRKLRDQLSGLSLELDKYLAVEYGVDPAKPRLFAAWRASHQPFHWFAEFYGVMREGGFDVVIGNPPYVELRLVRAQYHLRGFVSEPAGNLYALCMERSAQLVHDSSTFGMIVPTGLMGLDDAYDLRQLLLTAYSSSYCSTYAIRPSKLFDGVDQRLCIFLGMKQRSMKAHRLWTTRYHHWNSEERPTLLNRLTYVATPFNDRLKIIPQVGSIASGAVLAKLELLAGKTFASLYSRDGVLLHYHRSPRYWIRAMNFEQFFKSATRSRSVSHFRDLILKDQAASNLVGSVVNSSLFFHWFVVVGNGRNITGRDIEQFPASAAPPSRALGNLFDKLMTDLQLNSIIRERRDCSFQEFKPSLSKSIIDKIDLELGKLYGFSADETDFIINYDIKYRMGSTDEDE
jgi:hypothetical protein